jgi:hypothetical protein
LNPRRKLTLKVLTDGQAKEINSLLEQIKKSKFKGEAILGAKAVQDVLLQAEEVTLKISC